MFIGKDLGFFDRVFQVENLRDLEEYLSKRAGVPVRLPISNPSATAKASPTLSDASIRRIMDLYREDYKLLAQFYRP